MAKSPPKSAAELRKSISALEKELHAAEEAERKAALAGDARRATALLSAMRTAMKDLESLFPGTFSGAKWDAITPQSWPRDTAFKRAAGLTDSDVKEAREAGRKAVAGIK